MKQHPALMRINALITCTCMYLWFMHVRFYVLYACVFVCVRVRVFKCVCVCTCLWLHVRHAATALTLHLRSSTNPSLTARTHAHTHARAPTLSLFHTHKLQTERGVGGAGRHVYVIVRASCIGRRRHCTRYTWYRVDVIAL